MKSNNLNTRKHADYIQMLNNDKQ